MNALPMDHDLTQLLRGFDYEPGRLTARVIALADGREVLQIRVELGLLQMECEGRPDGKPSVIAAQKAAGDDPAMRTESRPHSAHDDSPRASLSSADYESHAKLTTEIAAAIRLEIVQFQHRAVAFLALDDAQRAMADAQTALEGAAMLCSRAEASEREWAEGMSFSILVLRTRAMCAALKSVGRVRDAGAAIDGGLALMREVAERVGIVGRFDVLGDVAALRALRDTLTPQLPPAQRSEFEARLFAAIRAENYELAAILRDELRLL